MVMFECKVWLVALIMSLLGSKGATSLHTALVECNTLSNSCVSMVLFIHFTQCTFWPLSSVCRIIMGSGVYSLKNYIAVYPLLRIVQCGDSQSDGLAATTCWRY